MRETWGPAWFATALCALVLTTLILGRWEAAAPAFFCFLPVVFFQLTRTIASLTKRIEDLERSPHGEPTT